MFAIGIAWGVSAIITAAGGFDEGSPARTDRRLNVLQESNWIRFPYPGTITKSISTMVLYMQYELDIFRCFEWLQMAQSSAFSFDQFKQLSIKHQLLRCLNVFLQKQIMAR